MVNSLNFPCASNAHIKVCRRLKVFLRLYAIVLGPYLNALIRASGFGLEHGCTCTKRIGARTVSKTEATAPGQICTSALKGAMTQCGSHSMDLVLEASQ